MRRKSRKPVTDTKSGKSEPMGPSEVGRRAGISKQAASKRLLRGESPEHIIETVKLRKERMAAFHRGARRVNGGINSADSTHANGANGSYADAARMKLLMQANREQLKFRVESGELILAAQAEALITGALVYFTGALKILPGRLRDETAP